MTFRAKRILYRQATECRNVETPKAKRPASGQIVINRPVAKRFRKMTCPFYEPRTLH
ncbi:hypothetical protein [Dyella sp. 2HG41-7]|uniref:hypothetical protein n=1 Tax=Dyella sp. 2HG41-7 TaxID=2883239 RepID=UPI001F1BFFB8|nr:hypothetical protein [Dyella sp. 2HG41-7]